MRDGHFVFGLGGNVLGQSARLDVVPDAGVAVTLLTNVGSSAALWRAIGNEVFGGLAGVRMRPELELPATPPELDLSVYVGTYERLSVKAEVALETGGLVMMITSTGAVAKLLPEQAVQRVTLAPGAQAMPRVG